MKDKLKIFFKGIFAFLFFLLTQNFLFTKKIFSEEKTGIPESAVSRYTSIFDSYLDSLVDYIRKTMEASSLSGFANSFIISAFLTLLAIVIFYFSGKIAGRLTKKWFTKKLIKKTAKKEEVKEIIKVEKVILPFFILAGLQIAILPLEAYFNQTINFIRVPIKAFLVFTAALLVQRIISSISIIWGNKFSKTTEADIDNQLLPLFLALSKVAVLTFGVLFALSTLGLDITPLIASLGALTFALGFAVKDSLSNFVAGIFLIFEKACTVGDKVDIPGIGIGYIHEIGLRTTKLRTFDNEIIIIPNNSLMNKEFKNFRMPDVNIRVVVPFSVSYGTDVDKTKKIVLKVLKNIEGALKEPEPVVEFCEMADFSLNFNAKFYVEDYSLQYDKKLEAVEKIYKELCKEKIDIPFPTYSVHLSDSVKKKKR
ncbi:MAG: mechanosensitive ion channel family protein [Spirochaetia bacterium]|nr:mechanosensitive ion channel family protein [Spirochaetia bacterium]